MSIASEISRLTQLRTNIRAKLISLGIISDSSADLEDCYDGIYDVDGRTAADVSTVQNIITFPKGYYNSALTFETPSNVQYYYTGSSAPSNSIGADGNLYLQTTATDDWLDNDAELVSTIYSNSYALEDTAYASWTPSTSAKTIVASATASTFTADMSTYDYLLRWRIQFVSAYASGTTLNAAPVNQCTVLYQMLYQRPSSLANLTSATFGTSLCEALPVMGLLEYYNSSGTDTMGYVTSYGFYASATNATFSSTTATNPTVTIKTPSLNVKCSSSYFSTSMASALDQTNSELVVIGELYRFPIGAVKRSMVATLVSMHNNPISAS